MAKASTGYRLKYMEVYNWGTFDREVYRISPKGKNALLTGANGSGKTTYIDALLSLLVPLRRYRFYNQSSNTQKKNERTEASYMLGAFGERQEAGKLNSTTDYLRTKQDYSVILAVFYDAQQKQNLTLFQVRYFSSGDLKRHYGIAREALSISRDFKNLDNRGDWKKALKRKYQKSGLQAGLYFASSARQYAQKFIRLFGMRSEKALSLFNQTVGIKVLGDLNLFIRENMLENPGIEEDFELLYQNFQDLLQAQGQIEKASEQMRQLQQIAQLAEAYEKTGEAIEDYRNQQLTARYYFAEAGKLLVQSALSESEKQLDQLAEDLLRAEQREEQLSQDLEVLQQNLSNNQIGRQIAQLSRDIAQKEQELSNRQRQAEAYKKIQQQLPELHEVVDQHFFAANQKKAQEHIGLQEKQLLELRNQVFELRKEREAKEASLAEIQQDLKLLRKQKNKITGHPQRIRQQILEATGASTVDIPFVGELIKVADSARDWEAAIEQLLHNFGLQLLVPDTYYKAVNRYVNQTNLRGKIVYQHIRQQPPFEAMDLDPKALYHKLELKESPYRSWIEQQLAGPLLYIGVEDIAEMGVYEKAFTINGLQKNRRRHQKDDRPRRMGASNYILGWDNKDKIRSLEKQGRELQQSIQQLQQQQAELEKAIQKSDKRRDLFKDLLRFEHFNSLDWRRTRLEIDGLQQRKAELEAQDEQGKVLRKQINETKTSIKACKQEQKQLIKAQGQQENLYQNLQKQQQQFQAVLADMPKGLNIPEKYPAFEQRFAPYFKEKNSLENLPTRQAKLSKALEKELQQLERKANKQELKLRERMADFKEPRDQKIRTAFPDWLSDTQQLSLDVDYVDEYIKMLHRIERDDLPRFQDRFNKYLNEQMVEQMGSFREKLYNAALNIEENIQSLNTSLQNIRYRNIPATYIQLQMPKNQQDQDIRQFKKLLDAAVPDAIRLKQDQEGSYKKNIFQKIKNLIDKLSAPEQQRWRNKVMDVRNWYQYYAQEFYQETQEHFKVYKDMGKLSGGEKAQLTYTILGSAIAYQFGIQEEQQRKSFRFVAVDESFSNQDDEKAEYLMNLCKQLELQLLVVTPSDKINVVKRHISTIHYVRRINNRNSVVTDLSILDYETLRKEGRIDD